MFFFICRQIDVSGNRKAVVIHVPYRLRKGFRKIHVRLVRELEKKFSGKVSNAFMFAVNMLLLLSFTFSVNLSHGFVSLHTFDTC